MIDLRDIILLVAMVLCSMNRELELKSNNTVLISDWQYYTSLFDVVITC